MDIIIPALQSVDYFDLVVFDVDYFHSGRNCESDLSLVIW